MLNITDNNKDNILNHYLNKSYESIKSYLNYTDDEMEDKFSTQIIDLAMFYYRNKDNTGVVQMSQGSRSISKEKGIPKEIIDSLPMPRVRVIGGGR